MLKKSITFKDVFDVDRTEDFYFNISKAELTELELTTPGGYGYYIQRVSTAKTPKETFEALKAIVKLSYGLRMENGSFVKKPETIWYEFEGSGAYDVLMMSFFEDVKDENGKVIEKSEDAAANFVNSVFPKELIDEAQRRQAEQDKKLHEDGFRPGVSTERPTPPVAGLDRVQERLAEQTPFIQDTESDGNHTPQQ